MAEEETTTTVDPAEAEAPPEKKGGLLPAVVWGVLGLLLGSGGFLMPHFMPGLFGGEEVVAEEVPEVEENVEMDFIEFGEVVVNIQSERLNRYLKIKVTLLVRLEDKLEIEELVTKQSALLKSWILSHVSDMSMNDIRGAAGQHQLRREIQDHFNTVLFSDGYDRIRDVLFEEFNIQ